MSDNLIQFPKKKKNLRRLILSLSTLILLGVLITGAILYADDIAGALARLSAGEAADFAAHSFVEHTENRYALYDGGMAMASVGGLDLLDQNSDRRVRILEDLTSPALRVGSERILAYSTGGDIILVADSDMREQASIETAGQLLDVDISADDAICYAVVTSSHKTQITVQNPSGQEIYKWNSASTHLPLCAVSEHGSYMAALAYTQEGGSFVAEAQLFDTTSETPLQSVSLGGQLYFDLAFLTSQKLVAVGETSSVFLNAAGQSTSYSYEGNALQQFQILPNGTLLLVLSSSRGTQLRLVSGDGVLLATDTITEQVLSVHGDGDYIAALTPNNIRIYIDDLQPHAMVTDVIGASEVLMQDSGTCTFLRGGVAETYIS